MKSKPTTTSERLHTREREIAILTHMLESERARHAAELADLAERLESSERRAEEALKAHQEMEGRASAAENKLASLSRLREPNQLAATVLPQYQAIEANTEASAQDRPKHLSEAPPLEKLAESVMISPANSHQPPADIAAPSLLQELGREIELEIILHIETSGDRLFLTGNWAGTPGQRLRVEGFGMRPLKVIEPRHLEYMAFGPAGKTTRWVSNGVLCGSRGLKLPLTGFAVRLAAEMRANFDILYQGCFFDTGISDICRNGEPCMPAFVDDPLEAIRLRLFERAGPRLR